MCFIAFRSRRKVSPLFQDWTVFYVWIHTCMGLSVRMSAHLQNLNVSFFFESVDLFVSLLQSHLRTRWLMEPRSSCWWPGLRTTWPVWRVGPSLQHTSSGPRMEPLWRGPTSPRWLTHTHAHMRMIGNTRVQVMQHKTMFITLRWDLHNLTCLLVAS